MQNNTTVTVNNLPILLECEELARLIAEAENSAENPAVPNSAAGGNTDNQSERKIHANLLTIVDVGKAEHFAESHIRNARPVEYTAFVRSEGKTGGLLPTIETMQSLMQVIGASAQSHIVCYDRQGGSAASRLIWTLHAFGFNNCSLLNGGLEAWVGQGYPTAAGNPATIETPAPIELLATRRNVVNSDELLAMISSDNHPALLDARSRAEYDGEDVRSARGGHIPQARWLEWTDALDARNYRKLLPDEALLEQVTKAGFKRDDTIVAYCQTHQRSSLSYVMLKHLGFENVLGLEGAWSAWGNREDTPVES